MQQEVPKGVDHQLKPTRASEERFDECFEVPRNWEPIRNTNVLKYFAGSWFYDPNCNNEILEKQHKSLDALKQLRGLEYALEETKYEPRLFIIVKQQREDEFTTKKKAIYYVFENNIYQAPNVRQVCLRRVRNASENIHQAMEYLSKNRAFNSVEGRTWNFEEDKSGIWKESAETSRFKQQDVKRRRKEKDSKSIDLAIRNTLGLMMKPIE